MASTLSGLSASVTRILYLTGFPKELKTKDIQSAFSEWEGISGGFKIKWRDDTSLLIVFQDPVIAKRAYLSTIASPNPILGTATTIRPYDGQDAQQVIQSVNSRTHNSNPSRAHNARSNSISVLPSGQSRGNGIGSNGNNHNGSVRPSGSTGISIPENKFTNGREPSPTLPNLPTHPTLNSLISSSLSEGPEDALPADPAILAMGSQTEGGAPRIGNPGKRMLGAALGVRHPGLGPRVLNGGSPQGSEMDSIQKAMGGLAVAE